MGDAGSGTDACFPRSPGAESRNPASLDSLDCITQPCFRGLDNGSSGAAAHPRVELGSGPIEMELEGESRRCENCLVRAALLGGYLATIGQSGDQAARLRLDSALRR